MWLRFDSCTEYLSNLHRSAARKRLVVAFTVALMTSSFDLHLAFIVDCLPAAHPLSLIKMVVCPGCNIYFNTTRSHGSHLKQTTNPRCKRLLQFTPPPNSPSPGPSASDEDMQVDPVNHMLSELGPGFLDDSPDLDSAPWVEYDSCSDGVVEDEDFGDLEYDSEDDAAV